MKKLLLFLLILILPFSAAPGNQKAAAKTTDAYSGKVYHIFFHSLIMDPALAFAAEEREGYNDWMTTVYEFERILPKLFENDFMLIRYSDIYDTKNGKIIKKELILPEGKKPLILSFDDVNYYEYMKGDGFADRLSLDQDGNVSAIVLKNGKEVFDRRGDAVPILDDFVKKNPSFSYRGAKGILAVTGYQGVLGYRNLKDPSAIREAKRTADRLKATGWTFACHSYSHSKTFRDATITEEKLNDDLTRWKTVVAPVTGAANIFIAPFGVTFPLSDVRMKTVVSKGYSVYCSVGKEMRINEYPSVVVQERLNLDGFTMQKYPGRVSKYFFDPVPIVDPARSVFFPQR